MPITPSWRPLPSTPSSDVPPLLVSMEGGPADYTVRVTDMANVWVESLDRKRICMRAWDLNTSIDPSDTPENMAKFLTSIRSALDTSMSGHAQTSLALLPGTRESIGSDGLVLKINCEIPGLQTLRWTMQLAKAPASAIATSVVLPLIQAQVARTQEIEALTDLIRRKDSVMTKLLDKFETTGTGLENIFNSLSTSLSGRKKVNRAAAGEKVRGLAPFNQDEWREEMRNAADGPADVTSLLSCVFNGNGMPHESPIEMEETPGLDQWWHHFQGTKHVSLQNRPKKSPAKAPNPPTTETGVTGDDDDFQVQSTPPGLKASGGKNIDSTTVVAEEDLTASEDDAHSPQVPAKKSTQHKASTETGVARLGTIGGKRQPSKQPSPSPEPKTPRKTATPPDHDSETASEGDDDPTASLPASSSPQSPAKPPAGKVGLGRIGGPKPKAAQEERVARSTSPDEAPKQTATPKKLGIIGKRGPDTKRTVAGDDNGRGRSCEATQPTREAPRETSQERADRKRDELKRELEKKAAAGPAKKKRKF